MPEQRLACDASVVALLFTASDHLSDVVEAARNCETLPEAQGASILSDLRMLGGKDAGASQGDAEDEPMFEPVGLGLDSLGPPETPQTITIRFCPHDQPYRNGHDPALLLRALNEPGEIEVDADLSGIVPAVEAPMTAPVLGWTVTLTPNALVADSALRDVFEFVEGLCDLDTTRNALELPDLVPLPDLDPSGAVPAAETPKAAAGTDSAKSSPARTGTIRVDLERVDRLINLLGELVIAEAMLRQSMGECQQSKGVDDAIGQLKQLSGAIQESVMAIRAQPVRGLFQQLSRIVRETSKNTGKLARMVTIGDATEVDKTVTERLVDPLTHMIRNAVDHGLEQPEDREAAGKNPRGMVTLEAAHRSGRVIITLSDDGAGVNRARVRQIAEATRP